MNPPKKCGAVMLPAAVLTGPGATSCVVLADGSVAPVQILGATSGQTYVVGIAGQDLIANPVASATRLSCR